MSIQKTRIQSFLSYLRLVISRIRSQNNRSNLKKESDATTRTTKAALSKWQVGKYQGKDFLIIDSLADCPAGTGFLF